MKKAIVMSMMALTLASGCYGPFRLTKSLHRWNGEIQNKWAREGVFLVLAYFPIYGIAALGDAIIFNSIEFWGGQNPIASAANGNQKTLSSGDLKAVLNYSMKDSSIKIDAYKNNEHFRTIRMEHTADGMALKTAAGTLVATSRTLNDGSILIQDRSGNKIASYDRKEVDRALDIR